MAAVFLSPLHYIPWLGSLIAEAVLIGIMLHRKLAPRFPFFFISILFDVARGVILPAIGFANPKTYAYFYAYWLLVPLEYSFSFAVIYEIFRHTFKADIKFAPRTIRRFAVLNLLLVVVAAALVFNPAAHIENLASPILVVDRSVEFLRCALLVLIWAFAAKLKITWRHHLWGITFGLGMYSATGLITAAVDVATNRMCSHWLTPLPHFAYLLATIIWPIYLYREEPEREPLTREEIDLYRNVLGTVAKAVTEIRKRVLHDDNRN